MLEKLNDHAATPLKDGRAVPSVDELATPALDIWAQEEGYEKIELKLAGIRVKVKQQKISPHRLTTDG